MEKKWKLKHRNKLIGPVSIDEIKSYLMNGDIDSTTLVNHQNGDHWIPITKLTSLINSIELNTPSPSNSTPNPVKIKSNLRGNINNPKRPSRKLLFWLVPAALLFSCFFFVTYNTNSLSVQEYYVPQDIEHPGNARFSPTKQAFIIFDGNRVFEFNPYTTAFSNTQGLGGMASLSSTEERDGAIWFSKFGVRNEYGPFRITEYGHIARLDTQSNKITIDWIEPPKFKITADDVGLPSNNENVSCNFVPQEIIQSDEGMLWFAAHSRCDQSTKQISILVRMDPKSHEMEYFSFEQPNGYHAKIVGMTAGIEHTIWVALKDNRKPAGAIYIRRMDTLTPDNDPVAVELPITEQSGMTITSDGTLWVLGFPEGVLYKIDAHSMTTTRFDISPDCGQAGGDLIATKNNTLWFTKRYNSNTSCISKFNPLDGKIIDYHLAMNKHERIMDLFQDSQGQLWYIKWITNRGKGDHTEKDAATIGRFLMQD